MKVEEIDINRIVPPDVRMRHDIDPVEIDELAESIRQIGLLQPIIVRKVDEKYEIVAGERRYMAMEKLGKETILCCVADESKTPVLVPRMVENIQRVNTTPLEEADMVALLKRVYWLSSKEIAQLLGKSEGWVSQRLAVEDWEKKLYEAVRDGLISWSVAREIDAEKDPEIRADLIQAAIDYGLTIEGVAVRRKALHGIETQESETATEEQNGSSDFMTRYREKVDAVRCVVCGSAPGVYDISWVSVCQRCLKKSQTG